MSMVTFPILLTSAVSLGHPGTLPKFNAEVLNHAIKLGLACKCDVTEEMHFDRKNYFLCRFTKGVPNNTGQNPCLQKWKCIDSPSKWD